MTKRKPRDRALLLLAFVGLLPGTLAAQGIDIRVHDPVLIEQGGTYYVFFTGRGVSVLASRDLKTWEPRPPVFAEAPAWAAQQVPGFRGSSLWAPDISFHNGIYYLYYSVSSFGSNNSAIGVATNVTLDTADASFKWVDHGPVVRSVRGRDLWNAIDPNLVVDSAGTPWLTFGSFWTGMKLVKLAPDRLSVATPEQWQTVAARFRNWKLPDAAAADSLGAAIEAPFIFKKNDYYYLFVSWDRCCAGVRSTYKVVVGRSKSVTGPYLDRDGADLRHGGGSLVVQGDSAWAGVGHSATVTIKGTDYLVFHGYQISDNGRSKLWIQPIEWDANGWPRVTLTTSATR